MASRTAESGLRHSPLFATATLLAATGLTSWWTNGQLRPPDSLPLIVLLTLGVATGLVWRTTKSELRRILACWLALLVSGVGIVASLTGHRSIEACTGLFNTWETVRISRSYSLLTDELVCRNSRGTDSDAVALRGWDVFHGNSD